MQASTLMKVAAAGALATMCAAAAYVQDVATADADPLHPAPAAAQAQQAAPAIDMGSMFAAARR